MKFDAADIRQAYDQAKKIYAGYGVDTDAVLKKFKTVPISVHCWQGDDVAGFEKCDVATQNVVTGNHPGKARTPAELRQDIEKVLSFSPLKHKVNIHAVYGDKGLSIDRDKIKVEDYAEWIDWAKKNGVGMDFNATFFAHENMTHDMSLSNPDEKIRRYWVEHAKASRKVAYEIGKALGQPCVNNLWIPDGFKDNPASRLKYRKLLKESLDEIFEVKYDRKYLVDALEGKLFGIGTECYVTGSQDFYLAYAAKNGTGICLDSGHYHPTEVVSDKLSALSLFFDDILLHVSRGVRWDSDHVVIQSDELQNIFTEIKRADIFDKVHIGLDYFDASINRIVAWSVGLRAAGRCLLNALLEPTALIEKAEDEWNLSARLALSEEFKNLPSLAVWNMACLESGVPVGTEWIDEAAVYEAEVTSKR